MELKYKNYTEGDLVPFNEIKSIFEINQFALYQNKSLIDELKEEVRLLKNELKQTPDDLRKENRLLKDRIETMLRELNKFQKSYEDAYR